MHFCGSQKSGHHLWHSIIFDPLCETLQTLERASCQQTDVICDDRTSSSPKACSMSLAYHQASWEAPEDWIFRFLQDIKGFLELF